MKMKWVLQPLSLLLLVANLGCQSTVDGTRQLSAQKTDPDDKMLATTRAKAEKGDAEAQYNLGEWYAGGQYFISKTGGFFLTKNYAQACKWLNLATANGCDKAKTRLSEIEQIEANEKKLLEDTKIEAEKGDAKAQASLGKMYAPGEDDMNNPFDIAARNHSGAYHSGFYVNGVPHNYVEGAKWFRRAAEQGDTDGQRNIGAMYAYGDGVPQDYVEAYKWSNLAAAHGDTTANENRDYIARFMIPEQVAEAQRRSEAFVPRKETTGSSSDNSISPTNPSFSGTGFFITDDGYLISNYHVVKDATKVRLLTSAGLIDARVVQVDAANDLALLKADGRFAPLPIAASRMVNLGGTGATLGFPHIGMQGFAPKLAKGEIASLSGAGDDPRYFQISVPVQPGNSGGALVDERGNVIGIRSAKLSARAALAASGALPENVNYAVKSSLLLSFLESVPDVLAKLKEPATVDEKFEDVVKSAQGAAVLVLVY